MVDGFDDLFVNPDSADIDHARVEKAAENELEAITHGLTAIGHLIWVSHTYTDPLEPSVEREHMAALDHFIQRLSAQVNQLHEIASTAGYLARATEGAPQ